MRERNRLSYRNRIRLPVILTIVIFGGLVGMRYIKLVRAHHTENRLSTELRNLNHEIVSLNSHIADLKGRRQALLSEDSLTASVAARGLKLATFDQSTVIHIGQRTDGGKTVAQTSTAQHQ